MASTPTTTTISKTDLDPLGKHLCTHLLTQLRQAHTLTLRITSHKAKFSRAEYKLASKSATHDLRDSFELSIYPYQSLYELLGKKLYQLWSLYYRELCKLRVLCGWIMEARPDMRNMRNLIAHNFNTGEYYHDEGGLLLEEDEDDTMAGRKWSAGAYWDFLERELEPLRSELGIAIRIFEEALPLIAVKIVEKSPAQEEEEAERESWKMSTEEIIPENWGTGDEVKWVCEVCEEVKWVCEEVCEEVPEASGSQGAQIGQLRRAVRVMLGFFAVGVLNAFSAVRANF